MQSRKRRFILVGPALVAGAFVSDPIVAAGGAVSSNEASPAITWASGSFEVCLQELASTARDRDVPQGVITERLLGLAADPDVLAATRNQAEFEKPIWAYLDAGVTEARIREGQQKLQEWALTLEGIEHRFGIDRYTLVAFWGVESSYGAVLDNASVVRPVIRSLATLACGDASRSGYWRDELIAALQISGNGDVAPERFTGSWAGAMGHTQFMPRVYLAQAVDFDGDGNRDIWTSVPDALASTANYLKATGWQPGERWGAEVVLPEGFDYALADEVTERSLSEWRQLGVRPANASLAPTSDTTRATLVLPMGARGPAFLLMQNFRAILRYNTALAYALTVAHLSDRLRGAPALARDWPRSDVFLTLEERRDLQTRLTERGYPVGGIDGKVGPRTRAAIRAYQAAIGLPPDGYADASLLTRIKAAP
ncbi:lytic murein transglycosylase [Methylobacterium iners]|uniref:Tn3 family transposase TnXax1 n=1 Tax=Methylobacterium iners TaxID=418707 RepID=A0ABQ4S7Y0_9HYPH|nr:lytic murein transglycosylase [Methylobacterium iners]GJD97872.1 Tn3 family transposase TnXax1 [Methylobacterium iners]